MYVCVTCRVPLVFLDLVAPLVVKEIKVMMGKTVVMARQGMMALMHPRERRDQPEQR